MTLPISDRPPFPAYVPLTLPRPYQQRVLEDSWHRPAAAYCFDPGTGKTKLTLDVAAALHAAGAIDTVLVIPPKNVVPVWPAQMERHYGARVPYAHWFWLGASASRAHLEAGRALWQRQDGTLRVFIVHQEALSAGGKKGTAFQALERMVRANGARTLLVVDESHRCKSPSASRTKALWGLADRCAYRRILTGTPMAEYVDLYAQYRILGENIIGVRTFAEFKRLYCVERQINAHVRVVVGYQDTEKLLERVRPVTYTVRKSDVLPELPPRVSSVLSVSLSPEQRDAYEAYRLAGLVELDALGPQPAVAALPVTKLVRMQQVLSGFLPMDDGTVRELPCPRVEACVNLVLERQKKALVWCRFREDIVRLHRAFDAQGIDTAKYYGDSPMAQRQTELARYRTDDRVRVLLATPATGGEGLDILEAKLVVWYSYVWSYLQRYQANDRTDRLGQDTAVEYVDLHVPGRVDDRMLALYERRETMANVLRDATKLRELFQPAASWQDALVLSAS
jgi:hypothetical protein